MGKNTKKIIVTVDTEGDNCWNQLYSQNGVCHTTNHNGQYIERFQLLCEKYKLIPTYLVNYEMSQSKTFVSIAQAALVEGKTEIGMHMHGWSVPPYHQLNKKNIGECGKPFIGEYPYEVIEQKVDYLTKTLEDIFQCRICGERSGRWYIDPIYIGILKKNGYYVDCTVTPGINWKRTRGTTWFSRCIDYSVYPRYAYEMDINKLDHEGKSKFYEVPMTIYTDDSVYNYDKLKDRIINRDFQKKTLWLRPNGRNLEQMLQVVDKSMEDKSNYIEFMIHSSELMPGQNPTFPSQAAINKLYCDMDTLFAKIAVNYEGIGLVKYVDSIYK